MPDDDARARWEEAYRQAGDPPSARTFSGMPLRSVYAPSDVADSRP